MAEAIGDLEETEIELVVERGGCGKDLAAEGERRRAGGAGLAVVAGSAVQPDLDAVARMRDRWHRFAARRDVDAQAHRRSEGLGALDGELGVVGEGRCGEKYGPDEGETFLHGVILPAEFLRP